MSRFRQRAARAAELADRYHASREALRFFAGVSLFQASGGSLEQLRSLVLRIGPPMLREAAHAAEHIAWFQRVLAEMHTPAPVDHPPVCNECPHCANPPQLGILRPHGTGSALTLACALCRYEWPFPRRQCPSCGESAESKLQFAQTEQYPAIQTLTCEECRRYLHIIDLGKDPQAIPEADEISAQPLDVWAIQKGFAKIYPNLIGL